MRVLHLEAYISMDLQVCWQEWKSTGYKASTTMLFAPIDKFTLPQGDWR